MRPAVEKVAIDLMAYTWVAAVRRLQAAGLYVILVTRAERAACA